MRKLKTVIYTAVLSIAFSVSSVSAQDLTITGNENKIILTLEDAITKAQNRSKQLKLQQKNIEYAKKDLEDAYYGYKNASEYAYEHADFNYSVKRAEREYAKKLEPLWEEKIIYEIESQFDSIIEAEEKYDLAQAQLKLQEKKTQNAIKKEQLGLGSDTATKAEKASLDTQINEIKNLEQTITAEYRKLNDKIGGKDQRYTLIKENIYEPVDQKRSLDGYISYAMSMNPGIWLQSEIAELQENIIGANELDGSGAPTYTVYQKSKIGYEQGLMSVSATKETAELGLKELYEGILGLEIQYEKALLALEETQRQCKVLEKQYELGFIPSITLEEAQLGARQIKTQINTLIRQHNKLKTQFEKSYIMQLT